MARQRKVELSVDEVAALINKVGPVVASNQLDVSRGNLTKLLKRNGYYFVKAWVKKEE